MEVSEATTIVQQISLLEVPAAGTFPGDHPIAGREIQAAQHNRKHALRHDATPEMLGRRSRRAARHASPAGCREEDKQTAEG